LLSALLGVVSEDLLGVARCGQAKGYKNSKAKFVVINKETQR